MIANGSEEMSDSTPRRSIQAPHGVAEFGPGELCDAMQFLYWGTCTPFRQGHLAVFLAGASTERVLFDSDSSLLKHGFASDAPGRATKHLQKIQL